MLNFIISLVCVVFIWPRVHVFFHHYKLADTNILCLRAPKNAKAVVGGTMAIVKSPLRSLGGDQAVSGGALFKIIGHRKLSWH